MPKSHVRSIAASLLLIALATSARATCGGGGGGGMGGMMPPSTGNMAPQVYYVPWKVLQTGDAPAKSALVLNWIPTAPDEMKHSELLNSRALTTYSSQCVAMQVIRNDDAAMIEKLASTGKLPAAVLTDGDGKIVARVDAEKGTLRLSPIEKMVKDEIRVREEAADKLLDDAKAKAGAGEKDAAIALYQKVWDQHCLLPKKGRDAQKALKKLDVTVEDSALRGVDPVLTSEMNARAGKLMSSGLEAEMDSNYPRAKSLYMEALRVDPGDVVPVRFLAELERHHLGDWKAARMLFDRVLTMQPDPLSRAVALHGLGKMTIHEGDSPKGLALFEQSIHAYPLALTYRNMAVYWNSERNRAKADAYVHKALALDPEDPFNLVFAATYMADSGRKDEALRIARENEGLLCASYNLAAIYALLGEKGRAMELLKRHFYSFERYDSVREKEMWEARVDYVFASLKDDPEFIQLTRLAK